MNHCRFDSFLGTMGPNLDRKSNAYLQRLELKSNGKSVILVTHDDRYFHIGDRVAAQDASWLSPRSSIDADSSGES